MAERGDIHCIEEYEFAKLLNHKSWHSGAPALRDRITGSDIDCVFDGAGYIVFCELSSKHSNWNQLGRGQRLLYQNIVRDTYHCAALLRHHVQSERGVAIDTRHDISSAHLMLWDGSRHVYWMLEKNSQWVNFLLRWINEVETADTLPGAIKLRNTYIAKAMEAA